MNSNNNSIKQPVKRRKFFFMLGAATLGIIALSGSPFKLIGSALGAGKNTTSPKSKSIFGKLLGSSTEAKQGITVTENPYAVRRNTKNGSPAGSGSKLNG